MILPITSVVDLKLTIVPKESFLFSSKSPIISWYVEVDLLKVVTTVRLRKNIPDNIWPISIQPVTQWCVSTSKTYLIKQMSYDII